MREKASRKLVSAKPTLITISEFCKRQDTDLKTTAQIGEVSQTHPIKVIDDVLQDMQDGKAPALVESNSSLKPVSTLDGHKDRTSNILQVRSETSSYEGLNDNPAFRLEAINQPVTMNDAIALTSDDRAAPAGSLQGKTPSVPKYQGDLDMLRPQLLSPLDTYEMSDREDSNSGESESEEEDESREPKKKVRRCTWSMGHIAHHHLVDGTPCASF